jgi:arsenate reductase-like glutaredoxin family protein
MAKNTEKNIAQDWYVKDCFTAKEIAKKLKLSEKTVGKWVDAGKWKELRISHQTTPNSLIAKYNELLENLLNKRLEFEKKADKDKDEATYRNTIDEMSKISAIVERLQADGRLSLRTHIVCIEKFMGALNHTNPKLFMQLIDFQKEYLPMLAEELK